jgi:hypothetical protein
MSLVNWYLGHRTRRALARVTCCLTALAVVSAPLVPGFTPTVRAAEGERSDSYVVKDSTSDDTVIDFLNAQIRKGWKDSEIAGSMKAPDNEWCRRVYLDVLGRVPTVTELNSFLKTAGNKKAKLLDRMLDSDEYVEQYARNFSTVWTILLVGRPPARPEREMTNRDGMTQYLRQSFLKNKPYDQMVYELVSATGNTKPGEKDYNGATNFLIGKLGEARQKPDYVEATSRTARYFLGLQVQCTQCHNHPFNDWKQDQFWSMNAFFRQTNSEVNRIGRDIDNAVLSNQDFRGEGSTPNEAEIYFELRNGQMQVAYPKFVDGTTINNSGYLRDVDRRAELGKLIMKSEYLGKAIANRMWAHFLGYGFTKPVDDIGPHNPPSHPELLEYLGKQFAANGHDLRKLIRWITLSEAYSLSSKTTPKNSKDDPTLGEKPKFSHFYLRQMQAEQLYESLLYATDAAKTKSADEREKAKAEWMKQFTVTFANDEGDDATTFNGTIPQALMMMNGEMIKSATSIEGGGFLANIVGNSDAIEYMYLAALSRKPTGADFAAMAAAGLTSRGDPLTSYQDIWWSLLNTNEFIFNH